MISSFYQAYHQSDAFGRLIFLGLYALSIVSWVVLLYKSYVFFKIRSKAKELPKILEQDQGQSIYSLNETLLKIPSHLISPFWKIYQVFKAKSMEVLNKNQSLSPNHESSHSCLLEGDLLFIEGQLQSVINSCVTALEIRLTILSTIVSLAPFLGLLGTVWGILITLSSLQNASSVHSNDLILGGLSLALTTTVLGLLIAMPALIGVNFFKAQLKVVHNDLETFSSDLLGKAEIQFKAKP
jgi:biopolymer transport protein TolQ